MLLQRCNNVVTTLMQRWETLADCNNVDQRCATVLSLFSLPLSSLFHSPLSPLSLTLYSLLTGYNVAPTLLQRCYNVVTTLLQRCYNVATMLLQCCYNVVTTS